MCLRAHLLVLSIASLACASDDDAPTGQFTSAAGTATGGSPGTSGDGTSTGTAMTTVGPATTGPAGSSGAADNTSAAVDDSSGGAETSGGAVDPCAGLGDPVLVPPTSCDGPSGNTSTEIPANNLFSTSWFGCYFDEGGELVQDPSDNCEFACGPQGLCPGDQSGPECEANLRWFAADADRFGCGGRIRVTNCDNGNQVVLATLDRGPNCNVEMSCDTPVLDMSHDAMVFLFDGGTYGGCDQMPVVVEQVDASTPLGPL